MRVIDARAVHAYVCLPLLLLLLLVLWSGVCTHLCTLITSSSGSGSCRVSGRHGIFHLAREGPPAARRHLRWLVAAGAAACCSWPDHHLTAAFVGWALLGWGHRLSAARGRGRRCVWSLGCCGNRGRGTEHAHGWRRAACRLHAGLPLCVLVALTCSLLWELEACVLSPAALLCALFPSSPWCCDAHPQRGCTSGDSV